LELMQMSSRPVRSLWWTALCFAALLLMLGGCATQTRALLQSPPAGLPRSAELADTPFFPQTAYQCGPAALATVLAAAALPADPEVLGQQVFLPARTGTLQIEMMAGARRQGAVPTRLPPTLEALLQEVQAGHPVVVLQNLGLSWAPMWHYAVAVGYDLDTREIVLRSGTTRREVMPLRTFEHTWRRSGAWAFTALPPGQWPRMADEHAIVEASVGFERIAPPAQAAAVYRSALERVPRSLTLLMGLGNSLYAAGDRRAAADAFREAAQAHASAPAWINLASTLLELDRRDEALDAARQAVAVSDAAWRERADAVLAQAIAAAPR
jgi:tetratricopeptide (TPR) repeat protein